MITYWSEIVSSSPQLGGQPRIRNPYLFLAPYAGSGQLQVDLKGGLFNATVLPLAGTAMVVNIGPSEAKVRVGRGGVP